MAEQILVFVIVILLLVSFWREWLSPELAALTGMGVLLGFGIISPPEVLESFSNSALVTVGCMFVLTAALERTGVIDALGRWFTRAAGRSERRALLLIMLIPLVLSPFINNTPIVVILMPVVLSFCRGSGVKPTKLLIPLSFAAILGGTCSLIGTSTNLLVDGIARKAGEPAFSLFEITPLGLIYAVVGSAYILFFGRRLLPSRDTVSSLLTPELSREFLVQAMVTAGSPLVGKTLVESPLMAKGTNGILEVKRRGVPLTDRLDEIRLEEGDRILLRAGTGGVHALRKERGLNVGLGEEFGLTPLENRQAVLVEAILGPNSPLIGRSLRESGFRERFGTIVAAMHRHGVALHHRFEDLPLEFGDVLLLEGERERISRLLDSENFISLSEPKIHADRSSRAPIALAAMAAFVVLGAFGVDTLTLALLGALAVMLGGCVKPEEAYAAIEWKILFIIAGMLGIAKGMDNTGGAATLAHAATVWLEPLGPIAVVSALYLVATILTELVSNNAVAILLSPIALDIAHRLDADPRALLVAVMFGASASFSTPIGYQTNTYVFGAGGYRFRDFLKVGVPLNILMWITASIAIPILWNL